jgi:hypothetical protein
MTGKTLAWARRYDAAMAAATRDRAANRAAVAGALRAALAGPNRPAARLTAIATNQARG